MSTATKLLCRRPADPVQLETRTTAMPRPGKGEVLVRVEATSVNPIDVKRAKGNQVSAYIRTLSVCDGRSLPLRADALALGLVSLCDGVHRLFEAIDA
ncbi:hypothetical protein [Paraburkholderia phytofirmans]|nr:hypothetical protein [Paraburkholderia phytofirmans]